MNKTYEVVVVMEVDAQSTTDATRRVARACKLLNDTEISSVRIEDAEPLEGDTST